MHKLLNVTKLECLPRFMHISLLKNMKQRDEISKPAIHNRKCLYNNPFSLSN